MKPSDKDQAWETTRDRVIGLGERSVHKNYYPVLRRNVADLQKLMSAIEQTTVGMVICNRIGVIEFANAAMCQMTGYTAAELAGRTPRLFRSQSTPAQLYRDMWRRLNAGQPWQGDLLNRRKDGQTYWTRLLVTPVRDQMDTITHFVGISEDITERVEAEERQRLLVDELNHRVKNTLAVIQALAAQTLRLADTPADFCREFEARLASVSQTHNLLNLSAWSGALLCQVLEQELAPYAADDPGRFVMRGEELRIAPDAAVTLGMAFHELATNAVRFGALSQPGGRIEVAWSISGRGPDHRLRLEWSEQDGPAVLAPHRRGFGMSLLERGLAHQLGGRVQVHFADEGIRCLMDLPLARLAASGP